MEITLEVIFVKDLIRLKGNCPSGYHCRTRHPQGLAILSAGSVAKERGRILKCLNKQRQEWRQVQLYPANAMKRGKRNAAVNDAFRLTLTGGYERSVLPHGLILHQTLGI